MTSETKYTLKEIYELLGRSLLLLQDLSITVVEQSISTEGPEEKRRVGLVDYIVRAVNDELLERYGETEESIAKALDESYVEFDRIAYAKNDMGVSIYKDIR